MGITLALLLGVAACNRIPESVTWREEVRLSDGRVIVVQRTDHYKGLRELGGPVQVKATASVRPDDPPSLFPELTIAMPMQVIDFDNAAGEWYAIGYTDFCSMWRAAGRPAFDRVEFRLREGSWVQVPLHTEYSGREANLLMARGVTLDRKSSTPITLAEKAGFNRTVDPYYRLVQPLTAAQIQCDQRV